MQRRVLVRVPGSGRFPPRPRRSRDRRRSASRSPARRDRADARVRGAAASDDRSRRAARRPARRCCCPTSSRATTWHRAACTRRLRRRRPCSRAPSARCCSRAPPATPRRARMGGAPFELRPGSSPRCSTSTTSCGAASARCAASRARCFDRAARRARHRSRQRGPDSPDELSRLRVSRLRARRRRERRGGRARAARAAARAAAARCRSITSSSRSPTIPSDPRGLWPADFDLLGRLRRRRARSTSSSPTRRTTRDFAIGSSRSCRASRRNRGADEPRRAAGARPCRRAASRRVVFVSRDREEELRDVARAIRREARGDGARARESDRGRVPSSAAVSLSGASRCSPTRACRIRRSTRCRSPPSRTRRCSISCWRSRAPAARARPRSRCCGRTLLQFEVDGAPGRPARRRGARRRPGRAARHRRSATRTPPRSTAFFGRDGRAGSIERERARAARRRRAAAVARRRCTPFRDGRSRVGAGRAPSSAFLRASRARRSGRRCLARSPPARARGRARRARRVWPTRFGATTTSARDAEELVGRDSSRDRSAARSRRGAAATGVHLVDAVAARFGEFDHVHLVGLVETDWPERPRRSIFYTSGLLKALGWPQEPDQMRAQQAAFRDLLRLAARDDRRCTRSSSRATPSSALSPMVDARAGSAGDRGDRAIGRAVLFADELLTRDGVPPTALDADDGRVAGAASPAPAARRRRPIAASSTRSRRRPIASAASIATSIVRSSTSRRACCGCPRNATRVSGLTPLERGTLVHALFEQFYRAWQARGPRHDHAGDAARRAGAVRATIARRGARAICPRPIARSRRRGCSARSSRRGVAERVFELEADAGGAIVDRLARARPARAVHVPAARRPRPERRSRSAARPIASTSSTTARCASIDYKLGKLPDLETSDADRGLRALRAAVARGGATAARIRSARRCTSRSATTASSRARLGGRRDRRRWPSRRARRQFADTVDADRGGRVPAAAAHARRLPVVRVRRRLPQGIPGRGR